MAIRNIWTVSDNNKVVSYKISYSLGMNMSETIANAHREIIYVFGGNPLDISLDSNNVIGTQLSLDNQQLDDRAVIDICNEFLSRDPSMSRSEYRMTAPSVFDWVYIQAVLQKFEDNIDLSAFTHFTDVRMQSDALFSSARAVAELKVLCSTGEKAVLDSFESFCQWREKTVYDAQEAPVIEDDYKILVKDPTHISIISRLSRNILTIVADSSGMKLWSDGGRYVLYHTEFNSEWLKDFALS